MNWDNGGNKPSTADRIGDLICGLLIASVVLYLAWHIAKAGWLPW